MKGHKVVHGTTEAETNLKIALKVQNLLEQSGATVILTRSDENAIYDLDKSTLREKKISDIHNRVKIGNESSADIFVSIHLNKIPQSEYHGWQCFYNTKNEKSIELAKKINGEIVSCDSMQIYKDMDIGSAKPTKEEMQGIKHYMIDTISPEQRYSVADYKKDAKKAIKEIIENGKTPIIVGGTRFIC